MKGGRTEERWNNDVGRKEMKGKKKEWGRDQVRWSERKGKGKRNESRFGERLME